ncbi:MAG: alternative ribosome rescue aminoacyl-tRNA hydrolase ArfB [Bacteroidales bacterium]|nr:alternative ribosome rescue aminoacyl-tRNA hydrolase ArfB [Bacteroidales bacterium]MDT8430313.1 alternative ribosome rescue aminoacyl-tRNA hydrolase ArfB [Bacteroidales bacterium]
MNDALLKETTILTSRASGPGGQHVNRTESKVELHWNLEESQVLDDAQKMLLRKRFGGRLTADGLLILTSQATRSQLKNREIVQRRFLDLVHKMLQPPKKRIRTKPGKGAVEKRLKQKKMQAEKKKRRGGDSLPQ